MITNDQLRMARAALRLNITDLAKLAGINKGTIVRIEAGFGAHPLTLKQLQEVLEIAGVIFIEADDNAGPASGSNWARRFRNALQAKAPSPARQAKAA